MRLFELFSNKYSVALNELRDPHTVTKTPEEIAAKYAGLNKPVKLKNPKNGEWILVSRDLSNMPDGLRITVFRQDRTPYDGHTEFKSAYDAFLEASKHGFTNVDGSVFEDDESYTPPTIEKGDAIMRGKFLNQKATVKGFSKDNHNQPVLKTNKGDIKLFKPRISKIDTVNEMRVTVWSGHTINVLHNPNKTSFENFAKKHEVLRGCMSYDGKDLYLWDAAQAVHPNIIQELGLEHIDCIFYNRGKWKGDVYAENGLYKPAIQRITPKAAPSEKEDSDLLKALFGDELIS